MDDIDFNECSTAKYIVLDSIDGKRRSYQHNWLTRGTSVSIVTLPRSSDAVMVRGCAMD